MDMNIFTQKLEGKYPPEIIKKTQEILTVINISEASKQNPPKNLSGVYELQTKGLLLTLPKFIWDDIEQIPSIKNTEGHEVFIMVCVLLIKEKIDSDFKDKSILETIAELVRYLKLYDKSKKDTMA